MIVFVFQKDHLHLWKLANLMALDVLIFTLMHGALGTVIG
jgi:hypothetical protein